MPSVRFENIGACVFDAYGTLFDVAAAAARCRPALGEAADALAALWRDKQLQYTWLRGLMGEHAEFWQVTGDALDYAMGALSLEDRDLRARLMDLYLTLDAYPRGGAGPEAAERRRDENRDSLERLAQDA